MDLFPTFARIAGGKVPDDRVIDGVDQTDFLLGEQEESNREGGDRLHGQRRLGREMGATGRSTLRSRTPYSAALLITGWRAYTT